MLLKLWAYFGQDDMWYDLLCGAGELAPPWLRVLTDKLTFTESIRLLCDHGLVEANSLTKENGVGSPGYSVHGCVHAWMVNVLHEQIDVDMVQLAVRCVASMVPSQEDGEYWRVQRRVLPHADRCLELMTEGSGMQTSELWTFGAFGNLYADQGRLNEAEAMHERALKGNEKALGLEHTSTLDTFNSLGSLYADQGRLDEAEAMYERALQGYEKTLDPIIFKKYVPALNTPECFGILYQEQGKPRLARQYYLCAQDGLRAVFGEDSDRVRIVCKRLKEVGA